MRDFDVFSKLLNRSQGTTWLVSGSNGENLIRA
jgi:hypothetical protein